MTNSPDFFHGTREESLSITFLSDFGYLESSRRYTRSKSKVVKIALNFRCFSPSQILEGRPSKSYSYVMTPASRHVVWKMFCGDTPTSPEVIVANTLNFRQHFKISRAKVFWGTPILIWVRAIKVWSISSAYKTLRGQHPPRGRNVVSPEKSTWVAQF